MLPRISYKVDDPRAQHGAVNNIGNPLRQGAIIEQFQAAAAANWDARRYGNSSPRFKKRQHLEVELDTENSLLKRPTIFSMGSHAGLGMPVLVNG